MVTVQSYESALMRWMSRNHGMLVSLATVAFTFAVLSYNLQANLSYYDVSTTFASTTTLAIAAAGATIVVISRGLDLSVGAVVSLSNCMIAANVSNDSSSMVLWAIVAVLAGAAIGLFNAVFIVLLRLPSVIVTLATMFIVEGLTLLVMEQPGGAVPSAFSEFFMSDAIAGWLPRPALLLGLVLMVWMCIRSTPLGTFIYAIGSDEEAARAKGVPTSATRMAVYVIAGTLYGLAGLFLTAQTGSGDPTLGPPLLLPVFVAVVLGGTALTGGSGGVLGTVFGAFTLMLIVNLLLVFNVPTYYSTVAEGILLIVAVLASSGSRLHHAWLSLGTGLKRLNSKLPTRGSYRSYDSKQARTDDTLPKGSLARWTRKNFGEISTSAPAWGGFLVVLLLTAIVFSGRIGAEHYLNSLLVLASFLAILALGQGVVVISGGLDLSVPAVITFSGVMLCEWAQAGLGNGAVVAVLLTGGMLGAMSGLGIGVLGIHPLIMTLALNGIVEGLTLVITEGTPQGLPPTLVTWLMTGQVMGLTPVIWFLALFCIAAHLLLARSAFGRKLYTTGASETVAFFSGVSVPRIHLAAYALSGTCAAAVGVLLAGFSGQAFIDMGNPYLLPSIAVVVIGGVAMTGGRGTFIGMLGGAFLLTALSVFLQGMLMPPAVRSVIFGLVILAAVIGLREKRHS
ncbi:ABC transporter permease [Agrobacterium fabacearum]|uniref:ABC transporter permease n=1 Tax=Agrobacterium tumefaciens TaxID=358 RepID=UPI0028536CC1|nr:ABC transporter permease [Agrobacterium tumefaciens]MDR5012556.1 ABC transporter permease [Agrobacterium tumefaciens]